MQRLKTPVAPPRIRDGLAADVEAAALLWERAHERRLGFVPAGARKERAMQVLRSRLTLPSSRFFVCSGDDGLTGMLLATQARDQDGAGEPVPGLLHVSYVAVSPECWSCGIASALLDRAASAAASNGYRQMQLWVVAENLRARSLYERHGFCWSRRTKTDEYGEHILHYVKTL